MTLVDADEASHVDEREVRRAVSVEIAQREAEIEAEADRPPWHERPIRGCEDKEDAAQNRPHRITPGCNCHVEKSVSVDILEHDLEGTLLSHPSNLRKKSAVAVSKEKGDIIRTIVGDNNVREAVPIQVPDSQPARGVPHRKSRLRSKRPVATAQHHGDVITRGVGHDQVGLAITTQIRDSDRRGCRTGW